jgi:PTS system fructose-specific IIC component
MNYSAKFKRRRYIRVRIVDLLKKDGISLGVSVSSKEDAIDVMVDLQDKSGNINNKKTYKKGILKRESEGSTAVGMGIAIPHTKNKAVIDPGIVAITVPDGVDYESPSGDMSTLLFMIAAPKDGGDVHLEVLSRLMVMLMDDTFANNLRAAKSADEFLEIIDKKETEKFS